LNIPALLLLQSASRTTRWQFTINITYIVSKRLSLVFIHGLQSQEIMHYKRELSKHRLLLARPTATATILIDQRVSLCSEQLRRCHFDIVDSEDAVHMRTEFNLNLPDHKTQPKTTQQKLDSIDFDTATSKLTGLLTRLTCCDFISAIFTPMIQSLDDINDRIAAELHNQSQLVAAAKEIRALHDFQRGSLAGVSHRVQVVSKRAQALVQTVSKPKSIMHICINAGI
jgi:hypothetical protein